jgi:hypothetical protein
MLERCSACGKPFGIAEAAPGASTQTPVKAARPITTSAALSNCKKAPGAKYCSGELVVSLGLGGEQIDGLRFDSAEES